LVTKASFLFWRIKRGESQKRDKITTILKDRANMRIAYLSLFCNKNSFTSINTVFLTKNHGLLIANSFFINYSTTEDMVKLTPNLNPRGWDEMFSKDG
jgi:aspartyl/asparaginyl-tRNA synthetase